MSIAWLIGQFWPFLAAAAALLAGFVGKSVYDRRKMAEGAAAQARETQENDDAARRRAATAQGNVASLDAAARRERLREQSQAEHERRLRDVERDRRPRV